MGLATTAGLVQQLQEMSVYLQSARKKKTSNNSDDRRQSAYLSSQTKKKVLQEPAGSQGTYEDPILPGKVVTAR